MMKKTIFVLSALLVAAPAFAVTTHATDEGVAQAHKGAVSAKEKLHQAQHRGQGLRLRSEHAAQGKKHDFGSKVNEGARKTWDNTKEGAETAWDKTKQGSQNAWDKTKKGSVRALDKTKQGSAKAWDASKEGAGKAWDSARQRARELKNNVTE
jgi:hypothetical protein